MSHPDIPAPAMQALRDAVTSMSQDAEFLKASETQLEGYTFTTGQRLRDGVSAVGKTDPATVKWLQDLLTNDFNMKFN